MGRRESVTAKANTMEQPNVITDAIHIEAVLSCSERPCSRCKKDVLNVVGMTAEGSQTLQVFSMDPGTAQALAPAIEAIRPAYPSLARIACLATQRGTVVAATCPFCAQALPCTHLSFKLETLPIEQVTAQQRANSGPTGLSLIASSCSRWSNSSCGWPNGCPPLANGWPTEYSACTGRTELAALSIRSLVAASSTLSVGFSRG